MNKSRNSQTGEPQDLGEAAEQFMRAFTQLSAQYERAERSRSRRSRRQHPDVVARSETAADDSQAGGAA